MNLINHAVKTAIIEAIERANETFSMDDCTDAAEMLVSARVVDQDESGDFILGPKFSEYKSNEMVVSFIMGMLVTNNMIGEEETPS